MIKLWLLSAATVWFLNMSSQSIQSEHIRSEMSYYSLSDQFFYKDAQNTEINFQVNGAFGGGFTLLTRNIESLKWRHTLTLKYYATADYQMSVYQTGLEYVIVRHERILQQFIGFDFSVMNMDLKALQDYGSMQESFGYGAHIGVEGYFVVWEKLAHYFVSSGIRRQQFVFETQPDVPNQTLNGNSVELGAGIGVRF